MMDLHFVPQEDHSKISHRLSIGGIGVFISLLFATVVLSFPRFFLFNPLAEGDGLRAFELTVSSLAWILLMIGPGIILVRYAAGSSNLISFLPLVGLLWPASLIVSHVTLYLQQGLWYTGYLIQYPIFMVTDIILPIFLVYLWDILRPRNKNKGATGAVGATGAAGATGAPGKSGTTGAQGATGESGVAGQDGNDGATGPIGATGLTGAKGAKGETGAVGRHG